METFFWGLLSLIAFIYLGYPLLVILLALPFGKNVKKDEDDLPSVSLLIAAYNEEDFIEQKIKNSLEIDYPREKFEIVIVSDGSTDRTDEIVRNYRDYGVRLFRVEGRVGKTQARNQAVLASRKDIIVFSDATTIYRQNAIRKIVRNFSDKKVGMVSGHLKYSDNKKSPLWFATVIYWAYESLLKKAQSHLYSLTDCLGCMHAVRRHLYHVLPPNIIENFTQPLLILGQNYRIVYESEAIATESIIQKPEQEFSMRAQVIRSGMSGVIYALRHLNFRKHQGVVLQLILHKILRWLVPLLLIQLFFINILCFLTLDSHVLDALMISQFVFYFFSILGLYTRLPGNFGKIISFPTYFLVVNAASLRAFYLTMTSEIDATWETNVY